MEGCPPLLLSILNTNSSSALLTVLFSRTVKSTYSFAHIWALTFWGTLCPSGIAADKKEFLLVRGVSVGGTVPVNCLPASSTDLVTVECVFFSTWLRDTDREISSPELEAGAGAGTGSGTNCIWGSDEELLVGTEPMSCRALTTAVAIVVLNEAKWS